MSEPMKAQDTEKYVELSFLVPASKATQLRAVMESALDLLKDSGSPIAEDFEENRLYSFEEVFPAHHPGKCIRGARYREAITQTQLANMIGVRRSHLSEMENGKRTIGKEMAKQLGKALNVGYKVFL